MRRFVNAQGDIAKVSRTRTKPYKWKVEIKRLLEADITFINIDSEEKALEILNENSDGYFNNKDGMWIEKNI